VSDSNFASSPTGIDLNPRPPQSVRVSKRAGVLFLLVAGGVLGAFGYGLYQRQAQQSKMSMGAGLQDHSKLTAATDAAKQIIGGISASSAPAHVESDELQPPLRVEPGTPITAQYRGPAPPPYPPAYYQGPQQQQAHYREPTPEEKRRMLAAQREQEALDAPTAARDSITGGGAPVAAPSPQGDMAQMAALLQSMQGPQRNVPNVAPRISITAAPSMAEEYESQNNQGVSGEGAERHKGIELHRVHADSAARQVRDQGRLGYSRDS
jgi:hypothetical protein